MGKFKFIDTKIEGVKIIQPTVFGDDRGYFFESYSYNEFAQNEIADIFVQDNQSRSKKNVLRGLHFQKKHPQSKLVRVVEGEVLDVCVDLRKDSKTFGQYESVVLSAENKKQFYIPKGFAHGFLVLSDFAIFAYKCSDYYAGPEDDGGIMWNDETINIDWGVDAKNLILSEKDKVYPSFKELF